MAVVLALVLIVQGFFCKLIRCFLTNKVVRMIPLANRFSQHDYLAGGEPVKGAALRIPAGLRP